MTSQVHSCRQFCRSYQMLSSNFLHFPKCSGLYHFWVCDVVVPMLLFKSFILKKKALPPIVWWFLCFQSMDAWLNLQCLAAWPVHGCHSCWLVWCVCLLVTINLSRWWGGRHWREEGENFLWYEFSYSHEEICWRRGRLSVCVCQLSVSLRSVILVHVFCGDVLQCAYHQSGWLRQN